MKTFKQHLVEKKTDTIYLMDIDDTLFFTKSKIYYTLPGETKERGVTTSEFAKIREKLPKDTKFDFREFRDYDSIYAGITTGKPNMKALKILDKAVQSGYKIGILTARGNQKAIYDSIKDALLFRDKEGKLNNLPDSQFKKRWVFAISDVATEKALKKMGSKGDGAQSSEDLKAFVLQSIIGDKEGFKNIVFVDDDPKNIETVENLNDPRIKTIKV